MHACYIHMLAGVQRQQVTVAFAIQDMAWIMMYVSSLTKYNENPLLAVEYTYVAACIPRHTHNNCGQVCKNSCAQW